MKLPNGEKVLLDERYLDNSEVMSEFLKLSAKKKDKDLEVEEEDLVEVAHPEPIYVAEALGDGALVENQNEQHRKLMDIVNKIPTGSLIHIYASCFGDLVSLAEKCENCGELEASKLISEASEKVLEQLPFVTAPKNG